MPLDINKSLVHIAERAALRGSYVGTSAGNIPAVTAGTPVTMTVVLTGSSFQPGDNLHVAPADVYTQFPGSTVAVIDARIATPGGTGLTTFPIFRDARITATSGPLGDATSTQTVSFSIDTTATITAPGRTGSFRITCTNPSILA